MSQTRRFRIDSFPQLPVIPGRVKLSLIAVCHFSSDVASVCVESFRREAGAAGFEPEVIIVDHSENDEEARLLQSCRPDRLLRRPNRGYAAGLNVGASESTGDLLFLANPDIEYLDGSVKALVDAVLGGAHVAGPQLFWDSACDVILPIPDDPHPAAELARTLRRRWPSSRHLERQIAASWRVWAADEPHGVPSLRGPLMVLSRDTFDRLGPLNDDYFLYYEETEWLWRARRRGARLMLVPKAHVVHRWGHATRRCGSTGEIEEQSRILFFKRNYSAPIRAILRRLSPREASIDERFVDLARPEAVPEIDADVWLLSIVSQMEPSVGCVRVDSLPPAIHELTSNGRWYAVAARRVNSRWRLQGRWTWQTS